MIPFPSFMEMWPNPTHAARGASLTRSSQNLGFTRMLLLNREGMDRTRWPSTEHILRFMKG
jgi:hypothetical protein